MAEAFAPGLGVLAEGQLSPGPAGMGGAHRAEYRGIVVAPPQPGTAAGRSRPARRAAADGVDAALLAALWQLPARQREVIALRIFLDLDTGTIAQRLGIEAGTVRMHLSRGVAALRRELTLINSTEAERSTSTTTSATTTCCAPQPPLCRRCRCRAPCGGVDHGQGPCPAPPHRDQAGRWLAPQGVAVLALGVGGVFGGHSAAPTGTTIRTAAFTLARNANGTTTADLATRPR